MQKVTTNSRFLIDEFSYRDWTEVGEPRGLGGLYHQTIIRRAIGSLITIREVNELGSRLVFLAEQAQVLRKFEALAAISETLINLPLSPGYSSIGKYFKAISVRGMHNDIALSTSLFDSVLAKAPARYKVRALLSLGANATFMQDMQSGKRYYVEAARLAMDEWFDPAMAVQSQRMTSVLKSWDGNHKGALMDLEALHAIASRVGTWQPFVYYDYLNSLAVELGNAGRIEEAANASNFVLASPLAPVYPEWKETREEIRLKAQRAFRSSLGTSASSLRPRQELSQAVSSQAHDSNRIRSSQSSRKTPLDLLPHRRAPLSARVLPFRGRKLERSATQLTAGHFGPATNLEAIQQTEKRAAVARLFMDEHTPVEVLDRMIEAARPLLDAERDDSPESIDLESPGQLEGMTRRWLNGAVSPDELAAVLSALRDCEDHNRRTNILNQMISYAFAETTLHFEAENDWRMRVEARLASPEEPEPA
jgi:hypothetical protein